MPLSHLKRGIAGKIISLIFLLNLSPILLGQLLALLPLHKVQILHHFEIHN